MADDSVSVKDFERLRSAVYSQSDKIAGLQLAIKGGEGRDDPAGLIARVVDLEQGHEAIRKEGDRVREELVAIRISLIEVTKIHERLTDLGARVEKIHRGLYSSENKQGIPLLTVVSQNTAALNRLNNTVRFIPLLLIIIPTSLLFLLVTLFYVVSKVS